MDLSGKVAVITGASRGLGAGIAQVGHELGMSLALCSRSLPVLASGPHVLARELDVTDSDALEDFTHEASERFGHVDLWINNAGLLEPVAPLREAPTEQLHRLLDVNVFGVALGSRAYLRLLHRLGGQGVLLNISSGAARKPYHGWSGYCASKAAVDRLSEVIALEEGERVRVHSVAPGVVETGMQETIRGKSSSDFKDVERFRGLHESGALLAPTDAGAALLRLAFDPAAAREAVCIDLRD